MTTKLKKLFACLMVCGLISALVIPTHVEAAAVHTVIFQYGAKAVAQQVIHGQNAVPPTDTYVPGFVFTNWQGNYKNVTSDRIILGAYQPAGSVVVAPVVAPVSPVIAQPTPTPTPTYLTTFTVKFVDDHTGETYYRQTVSYNADANPPSPPSHKGYRFRGYDGSWEKVTSDRTVYAKYERDEEVIWIISDDDYDDWD